MAKPQGRHGFRKPHEASAPTLYPKHTTAMERTYILKSPNPILEGTKTTIKGKCLTEIKIKLDRILAHPAWSAAIPVSKKGQRA